MLTLSSLFGDFAVFQSGIAVPVWGWTEPDCIVECNFNGQTLKVKSTPENLVDHIEVDITPLKLGQSLKVRDIKPEGFEILNSPSIPLVSVEITRALRSAATDAAKAEASSKKK